LKIIILLSFIVVIIIFVVIRFGGKGGKRFPWYEFYSLGRKEGFNFKEIRFLRRIVLQNKLEKPQSIFWATKQLDCCLRPSIQKIEKDEEIDENDKQDMISKLLGLRTKAEFSLPKYKKRIRETSSILPRQKLIIKEKNYGTFMAWVIEINRKYLVISKPSGQKGWEGLKWKGKKIGVYFWRQDDAGYFFETKVLEEITHEEYPLLYLAHSSNLQRLQKRKSIRVETNIRVRFSPIIKSPKEGEKKVFVSSKSYSGKIIDLSDTGCCMIAGKGLNKNERLKMDFFLTEDKQVIALGIIVNVSRTGDERVKKYHIMFLKINHASRNNILIYVYNIFGERKEDKEKSTHLPKSLPSETNSTKK